MTALVGTAVGVIGAGSASAGTYSGHLMVNVDSWIMRSARINGTCYNNLTPDSWTQTSAPGTFMGTIAVYSQNDCTGNLLGEVFITRDTSSFSNYWYTIHGSDLTLGGG